MKEEERSVDYVEREGEIVRRETERSQRKKKVLMKNQGKGLYEKGFFFNKIKID